MLMIAPELRFEGHADTWKQRKLGGLADFSKGQGYSKADLSDEGTPIILYGRLYTNYETTISDVDTFAAEREGSVKSRGNEVIVPGSGETAEDISVASAVFQSGVLLGGDLNIIRPSSELDQTFLALAITGASPHEQMAKRAQGKTVVHLHNEDLREIDITFPSVAEQKQIGSVFMRLDNLITLHQQEYDKLVTYKQAMMQKMFPKPGKDMPEVRFEGFEGPWSLRSLRDITYLAGVKNLDNLPLESYSVTADRGFMPQEEKFEHGGTMRDADKSFYTIVPPKTFAYNPARINVGSIGYWDGNADVIVSSLYEVFKTTDDVDDRFLWRWFKSELFPPLIERFQEGGVRLYFFYDKLCKCEMMLPDIEEQRAIAALFDDLDRLMNLRFQDLKKLNNMKSAFMQKLFI